MLILEVRSKDLPSGWDLKTPSRITQIIGDDFVEQGEASVFKVPANIIPTEYYYLINPNHSDAKRISAKSTSPMVIDRRFKIK